MQPEDNTPIDCAGTCAFGLLVGTLALMTAHVAAEVAAERLQLARKIVTNLHHLRHHPDAPQPLQHAASHLHARWVPMAMAPCQRVAAAETEVNPTVRPVWH